MRRELGIARCGLACCLCSENNGCDGCESESCPDAATCEVRSCSKGRGIAHCYECSSVCEAMAGAQLKARAFGEFARRFGEGHLLDCLERNEAAGVVYHRGGHHGRLRRLRRPRGADCIHRDRAPCVRALAAATSPNAAFG